MLAIKFQRIGKKGQASFRVVVAEKRSKLNGKVTDDLGWFNPGSDQFNIKKEAVQNWISKGAQPTDSVFNLLVRAGVVSGPKKSVHKKSKKLESEAVKNAVPAASVASQ